MVMDTDTLIMVGVILIMAGDILVTVGDILVMDVVTQVMDMPPLMPTTIAEEAPRMVAAIVATLCTTTLQETIPTPEII